ncbi:MAG: PKD domain-containing protein [Saprospiraceae bacterium]
MVTKISTTQIFTILICLLLSAPLSAAHLIGGVITYECLGDGDLPNTRKYQLIMRVYRDCAGNGAGFDCAYNGTFSATVTIHQEGLDTPFRNLVLEPPSIKPVDAGESNPCVIVPPNVCVEEGEYFFPVVELPIIDGSYTVSYQRCCRNGTITNINNPGDTGVTYSVEITPAAQQVCNDSPVFNNFPPPVVCVGEALNFDHAASDLDGDQLVYELCTPLRGGGTNSTNVFSQNGIAPDPESPPPYSGVGFVLPQFSFLNPLGGEANLQIDETTGLLTGVPTEQGQFVVGICVSEYRNGELLSVIRRDFQFNVSMCEILVNAGIKADSTNLLRDTFIINSCGDPSIFIENLSTQEEFITAHEWNFFIGNDTLQYNDWDVNLSLPDTGYYTGRLVLNPNFECKDTAYVEINLFPEVIADFSFEYDTCVADVVTFTNESTIIAQPPRGTFWVYGDGNDTSEVQNPTHLYDRPGNFPVEVRVVDANGCLDRQTKVIDYFPVPELLIVEPSTFIGCVPADIFFNNLSTPINESYDINWTFGDGGTSTVISPTHTYQDTGIFSINLAVTSPLGCSTASSFENIITVEPSPVADFVFSPNDPSNFNPEVVFTDQSSGAAEWLWNFDDFNSSTQQNPAFVFPDTGRFEILLQVVHQSGCIDSALQVIDVTPQITYWLPNAFTPNNDGQNDVFQGTGFLRGMRDFSMQIFNRYGEIIFASTDPLQSWNGQYQNTGKILNGGVYVYHIRYQSPRGQQVEEKGTLTLLH